MRFGAPLTVDSKDPGELAQAHVELGYQAGFCPWAPSMDDLSYLHALRDAFAERDVVIAEVIGWRNLLPADDAKREAAFAWVAEQLAVADEIDARCCVTFGGTVDNDNSWTPHPDNLTPAMFDRIVEVVRRLLDAVQPKRTKLALEMMGSVYPDSAESYLDLIQAVDRPGFAVHLDPVNIILTRQDYFRNGDLIRDCFRKLGPWIVSCHAKDVVWQRERGFHFAEAIPGTGVLDFRTYLTELDRLPGDIPLLLEHLYSPEEYRQGYDHLTALADELGIG
jgi:sugar phosphate isomerase/epimerase